MSITCRHLFVYGTLRRGSPHRLARTLAREAEFLGEASIQGRLYALGEYPGMTSAADPQDWVRGDVYRLHDPDAILPMLDEYEGCGAAHAEPYEFERVLGTVLLDRGTQIQCWVYMYRGQPIEASRIRSGEFLVSQQR